MPKKSNTKNARAQYAKKMRELRPFVDFNYDLRSDLTRHQKTRINTYYKEYQRLTAGKPYGIQVYRPKNKKRLKTARDLGGNDLKLPAFKVAFIPKTSPNQKIKFNKKGEATIKSQYVSEKFIPINSRDLAETNLNTDYKQNTDIKSYVDDLVKNRDEKVFTVLAGDYELKQSFTKKLVWQEVARLAHKYQDENNNHYFGNWMRGIIAYEFTGQENLDSYRKFKRETQINKDRRAKRKRGTIKLYYWYLPKNDSVTVTKENTAPEKGAKAITRGEYDNFIKTGKF